MVNRKTALVPIILLLFDAAIYSMLIFAAAVQEFFLNLYSYPDVKNAPNIYVLSYTYVRYLHIILSQKYEISLLYVPILEPTKIFVQIRANSMRNLSM